MTRPLFAGIYPCLDITAINDHMINKRPTKSLSIILTGLIMVFWGGASFVYHAASLLSPDRINLWTANHNILTQIFFTPRLPANIWMSYTFFRLITAVIQTIIGIGLISGKSLAIKGGRWFLPIALFLTYFNPYHAEIITMFSGALIITLIYTLNHPNTEQFLDPNSERQSSLILMLGIIETLVGIGLLKNTLWGVPLAGIPFQTSGHGPITVNYMLSQPILAFTAILLIIVGLAMTHYRPLGRALNILVVIAGFLLTCLQAVFMTPPQSLVMKAVYLILIVVSLLATSALFFFLTNPKIKKQFSVPQKESLQKKTIRLITTLIFVSSIWFGLHGILHSYSAQFTNDPNQSRYWVKKLQSENILYSDFPMLYSDPIPLLVERP